jgi:polar amino acid transport system permease protein
MKIEANGPPGEGSEKDHHWQMGVEIVQAQRKASLKLKLKIALVWVALFFLIFLALLQLDFKPRYVLEHYDFVLAGALTTIGVSLASIAIATVLALFGALGRLSKNAIAQGITGAYVSLIRGTPLLIQIYLIYLGLPQIGQQLIDHGYITVGRMFTLSAIQSGILALSLNYGAYMTEIFRAGIQSIGFGQREAAQAIGMSPWQTMKRVILPQAIRIIIPDIGNQFIAMQKDSALVSVMGIWEITYRANRLARKDARFMEMFILAGLMYWILTIISSYLEERLERRMAHAYER